MILKLKIDKDFLNSKMITYTFLCFLFATSCFILHKMKPFQPLYFFYFPVLVYFLFDIFRTKIIKMTKSQIMCFVCIVYWLLDIFFQYKFSFSQINIAISLSYFLLGTYFLNKLSPSMVNKICKYVLFFSLLYIFIDTLLRFSFNISLSKLLIAYGNTIARGEVKFNSVMSIDSNMVATYTVNCAFLSYYMYKFIDKSKYYLFAFITSVYLTITSVSRAATVFLILSLVIIEHFQFLKKHLIYLLILKKKLTAKLVSLFPIIILFTMLVIYKLFGFFSDDASWGTKLDLMKETIDFFHIANLQNILFGIGTNMEDVYLYLDRGAHLFVTSYLVYYGLCSLFLILLFWWQIIKETNSRAWIIILPTLLLGFSITLPSCQTFYVALAIIYYYEYILPRQIERSY